MTNELNDLAGQYLPAVETEMRSVLKADGSTDTPEQFYGMIHYHMGWVDADLKPLQANSGKRIRPLLCLLACQAAGGDWRQALPAAAAVEILHNFSLVHDDIEDASPTRRGRPTVWQLWGEPQAINVGDAMFAMAHLALNRLVDRGVPAETATRALRRFDETSVRLTQGQHADMCFETRDGVSVAEYMDMITGKTAVLLSLCGELGAMIAGADESTIQRYAGFGLDLGLAFQILDDVLGIWGDETLTGKSAATDIVTRKKTLPVLYGLERDARLRALYSSTENAPDFVEEVVARLDATGARSFAQAEAGRYSTAALNHLAAAQPTGQAAEALHQLADMLLNRKQ